LAIFATAIEHPISLQVSAENEAGKFTRLEYSIESSKPVAEFPLLYVDWGHGSGKLKPSVSLNLLVVSMYKKPLNFSCTMPYINMV